MANAEQVLFRSWSDFDEWRHIIEGEHIVFGKVSYFDDPEHPCQEGYANGKIYSFNRRHTDYIGDDKEEMIEDLISNHHAVQLSYHEHGNCTWFVRGTQQPPDMRWDGSYFAGLWVPEQDALDNIGDPNAEDFQTRLLEYAKGVCEHYTAWCNGNIYEYEVKLFKILRDEDGEIVTDEDFYDTFYAKPLQEERGGEYIDTVECQREAESVAKGMLK